MLELNSLAQTPLLASLTLQMHVLIQEQLMRSCCTSRNEESQLRLEYSLCFQGFECAVGDLSTMQPAAQLDSIAIHNCGQNLL